MTRDYPRLQIEDFGTQLLETGDLDPIYIALHGMDMDEDKLARWLVAYWCFYSAGVACFMSDCPDAPSFWRQMNTAAVNALPAPHGGRWERGAERRHFRGAQGTAAVDALTSQYPNGPTDMLRMLTAKEHSCETLTFQKVAQRAMSHRGFGNWMSFKVADMVDRVLGIPVKFELTDAMYETPTKAAIMLFDERWGLSKPGASDDVKITTSVMHLINWFGDSYAPPLQDRMVGFQEIETILCKWKSHMGGHYPVGKDLIEITHGLEPWLKFSPTASQFLGEMPGVYTRQMIQENA